MRAAHEHHELLRARLRICPQPVPRFEATAERRLQVRLQQLPRAASVGHPAAAQRLFAEC